MLHSSELALFKATLTKFFTLHSQFSSFRQGIYVLEMCKSLENISLCKMFLLQALLCKTDTHLARHASCSCTFILVLFSNFDHNCLLYLGTSLVLSICKSSHKRSLLLSEETKQENSQTRIRGCCKKE